MSEFLQDLTRRDILRGVTTVGTMAALSGSTLAQSNSNEEYQSVALLLGNVDTSPNNISALAPNGAFFDGPNYEKTHYAYIYQQPSGTQWYISQNDSAWTALSETQQQIITQQSDLPGPTNGTHTLADNTAYIFSGFVDSPYGLELGNASVLMGRHGGIDGFIHTGGNTALTGTDAGFFARDMTFMAPGGTMFNLSADQTTEMLVESVSFSDAAGIGQISSLGDITGYRVPSFKGCNFEDFADGLTFHGDADKVFISNSPFRTVTASGVDMLTLAGGSSIQIVDFSNNYVKDVQSDTVVWKVESGGEPSEVFQYRGNTHDTSITISNILTGPNADKDKEPFFISESYPLGNTAIIGETHNDSGGTVTISTQDTFTPINIPSTADTTLRFSQVADGKLQYEGSKQVIAEANLTASFYGANGDIYTFGVAFNGNIEPQHVGTVAGGGPNKNKTVVARGVFPLTHNDTVSIEVKNESNTSDPTIQHYAFSATEI
jgi:hypothetical protein